MLDEIRKELAALVDSSETITDEEAKKRLFALIAKHFAETTTEEDKYYTRLFMLELGLIPSILNQVSVSSPDPLSELRKSYAALSKTLSNNIDSCLSSLNAKEAIEAGKLELIAENIKLEIAKITGQESTDKEKRENLQAQVEGLERYVKKIRTDIQERDKAAKDVREFLSKPTDIKSLSPQAKEFLRELRRAAASNGEIHQTFAAWSKAVVDVLLLSKSNSGVYNAMKTLFGFINQSEKAAEKIVQDAIIDRAVVGNAQDVVVSAIKNAADANERTKKAEKSLESVKTVAGDLEEAKKSAAAAAEQLKQAQKKLLEEQEKLKQAEAAELKANETAAIAALKLQIVESDLKRVRQSGSVYSYASSARFKQGLPATTTVEDGDEMVALGWLVSRVMILQYLRPQYDFELAQEEKTRFSQSHAPQLNRNNGNTAPSFAGKQPPLAEKILEIIEDLYFERKKPTDVMLTLKASPYKDLHQVKQMMSKGQHHFKGNLSSTLNDPTPGFELPQDFKISEEEMQNPMSDKRKQVEALYRKVSYIGNMLAHPDKQSLLPYNLEKAKFFHNKAAAMEEKYQFIRDLRQATLEATTAATLAVPATAKK